MPSPSSDVCGHRCLEHIDYAFGNMTLPVFTDLIFCGIFVFASLIVYIDGWSIPKRNDLASPSYGIGGWKPIQLMSVVGVALIAPELVAYYGFLWTDDRAIACNIQQKDTVVSIGGVMLAYCILAILAGTPLRLITRKSLVNALDVDPEETTLIFPCGRGAISAYIADKVVTTGKVIHADQYSENKGRQNRTRLWLEENVRRLHVEDKSEVGRVHVHTHHSGLDVTFEAGSDVADLTVVVYPFTYCIGSGMPSDDLRNARMRDFFSELKRVAKPGSRIHILELSWRANIVKDIVEGVLEDVCLQDGTVWTGLFPARIICATCPGGKMVEELQEEEADEVVSGSQVETVAVEIAEQQAESALAEDQRRKRSIVTAIDEDDDDDDEGVLSAHMKLTSSAKALLALSVLVLVAWAVGLVALIDNQWCSLDVPKRLPWNNRLNNLVTGSLRILPLVSIPGFQQVLLFARDRSQTTCKLFSELAGFVGSTTLFLIIYNALFWLPSFLLDLALYGKMSDSTLTSINLALNTLVYYGVANGAPKLYQMQERRKAARKATSGDETQLLLARA